jgi:hypothetical protein
MKLHLLLIPALILLACSCSNPAKDEKKDVPNNALHDPDMQVMQGDTGKPKENPYKNAKIECKVFNNDSLKQDPNPHGFGYDIYLFDALYIHQPNIPAINGNRGYHTREQAMKAGGLVMYKIRNNIMPPAVTIQELDSIGVLK